MYADHERKIADIVGQAVGAGSMCWEDVEQAGVFQSDRASAIARRAALDVWSVACDFANDETVRELKKSQVRREPYVRFTHAIQGIVEDWARNGAPKPRDAMQLVINELESWIREMDPMSESSTRKAANDEVVHAHGECRCAPVISASPEYAAQDIDDSSDGTVPDFIALLPGSSGEGPYVELVPELFKVIVNGIHIGWVGKGRPGKDGGFYGRDSRALLVDGPALNHAGALEDVLARAVDERNTHGDTGGMEVVLRTNVLGHKKEG